MLPHSFPPLRKRGGQPGNSNARVHGYYGGRRPHPAVRTQAQLNSIGHLSTALFGVYRRARLAAYTGRVTARFQAYSAIPYSDILYAQLDRLERLLEKTYARITAVGFDHKTWRVHHALFLRAIDLDLALKRRLFKLEQETRLLEILAVRAPFLYNREFDELGIPPYPLPSSPLLPSLGQNSTSGSLSSFPLSAPRNSSLLPSPSERKTPRKSVKLVLSRRAELVEAAVEGSVAESSPPSTIDGLLSDNSVFVPPTLPKIRTNSAPVRRGRRAELVEASQDPAKPRPQVSSPPSTINGLPSDTAPSAPSLTDDQWRLVEPLLASLRGLQRRQRTYRPRTPRVDDRRLLDAILWKLAAAAPWKNLPARQISLRTCEKLYRQLRLSGRMAGIYTALHLHLVAHGGTTLPELVSQGCFQVVNGRVLLVSGGELTWQKYTALLLLQRTLVNQRTWKRQLDQERRHRGRYLRLPPLRLPAFRSRHYRRPPSPSYPALPSSPSSVVNGQSSDSDHPTTRPPDPFETIETSLAYKKWRAIQRVERSFLSHIAGKTHLPNTSSARPPPS